ncbi:unnamed protein product, partial [Ixodes persulcatus]
YTPVRIIVCQRSKVVCWLTVSPPTPHHLFCTCFILRADSCTVLALCTCRERSVFYRSVLEGCEGGVLLLLLSSVSLVCTKSVSQWRLLRAAILLLGRIGGRVMFPPRFAIYLLYHTVQFKRKKKK